MNIARAKDIAADQTGFYTPSLKMLAKKYILEHGTDSDKKILQRAHSNTNKVRLGEKQVQHIGNYNENNSDIDALGSMF